MAYIRLTSIGAVAALRHGTSKQRGSFVQQKRVGIGWLIVVAVVSLFVGGALAAFFGAHLLGYGQNSAALASATIDVAALERLRVGDVGGASKVLKVYLKSSLDTLAANESGLTRAQRERLAEVRKKAKELR